MKAPSYQHLISQAKAIEATWLSKGQAPNDVRLNEFKQIAREFVFSTLGVADYRLGVLDRMPVPCSLKTFQAAVISLERFGSLGVDDCFVLDGAKSAKPQASSAGQEGDTVLVVDSLRSAFNVGSMFRTADCLGVEKIILTGYTATPDHPGVKKAAMGCDDWVHWELVGSCADAVIRLKEQGYWVIAAETSGSALGEDQASRPNSVALVVGNERWGLSRETLDLVDEVVSISMKGKKNSMNVGVAAGILLQQLIKPC